MNDAEQLARMQEWLDTHPAPRQPFNAGTLEDEETLRRSFGGLSRRARRVQRRPVPIKVDELGYDQRGRYWGEPDGGEAA